MWLASGESQALVVLTPGAAKRLIARGVACLPNVKRAKEHGLIVVGLGTTNAYVLEELTGKEVEKERYCAGYISKELRVLPPEKRETMIVLERGEPKNLAWSEILARLSAGDVVIKGGNALDPEGTVGVLVAGEDGGTVGKFYAAALARGADIVIPISRIKSIHTPVSELCQRLGKGKLLWASGFKVGLFPLLGHVVTETEAVEILYGISAEHVASSGVGLGAGAVTLLLSGSREKVETAFREISELARAEPELHWEEE
ncbi:MAG: hypothetical protein NZ651_03885 [Candidatus Bipolaricaulota bacterium]|nr:hypothetical protein [Candidatus Bipolaricaulota bacterium]MDW8126893.1 hypothetical protein [Candidatus Bipolaricaulota bacterium]